MAVIIFLPRRQAFRQYGTVKRQDSFIQPIVSRRQLRYRRLVPFVVFALLALPSQAHASLFQGETLDSLANGISWVVLVIGPIIGIAAFWMVHILPEKIAEKKSTRRPKPFNASACSPFALADCSGQLHGFGLTPNRFCTKWLTAQTWMKATVTFGRK